MATKKRRLLKTTSSLPVQAKRQCTIRDKSKWVHHTVGVLEYSTVKEVCDLGHIRVIFMKKNNISLNCLRHRSGSDINCVQAQRNPDYFKIAE